MNWFLTVLTTGITSFVATNLDDIVLLMLFFSQVNEQFRPRQIIIGQYLGFTLILLASLPGLFGGLIIPKTWTGLLGLLPIFIGLKQLLKQEKDEEEIQTVSGASRFSWLKINPQIVNVASVTVANGGDNIGIYIPLFASSDLVSFAVIVGIFYLLVGVWCFVAYFLTRHSGVAKILTHYGHILTPWVLIALGIFILIESESYQLLGF